MTCWRASINSLAVVGTLLTAFCSATGQCTRPLKISRHERTHLQRSPNPEDRGVLSLYLRCKSRCYEAKALEEEVEYQSAQNALDGTEFPTRPIRRGPYLNTII